MDVPQGCAHRISNTGDEDLVFIEVQHGEYFGEDDIIRLDDDTAERPDPGIAADNPRPTWRRVAVNQCPENPLRPEVPPCLRRR